MQASAITGMEDTADRMTHKEEKMLSSGHAPIEVFYSYAREDVLFFRELEKHLSLLRRQSLISSWHYRQIVPGTNWAQDIDDHLNSASLILLLISADFLASDYCYGIEMKRALERHKEGTAHVIPILVRPVDWEKAPFKHLAVLPTDAKPITLWPDQDDAFKNIVQGVRVALEDVQRLTCEPSRHTPDQVVRAGPGPTQHIEVGDYSIAESNQMKNSARLGSQTVHGGDKTIVKGNTFEIC